MNGTSRATRVLTDQKLTRGNKGACVDSINFRLCCLTLATSFVLFLHLRGGGNRPTGGRRSLRPCALRGAAGGS